MIEEIVTITAEEYEDLLDAQRWMAALEAAGVDDWEGYEYAQDIYREGED